MSLINRMEFDVLKGAPLPWYNKSADLRASAGALWYCMKHKHPCSVAEDLGLGSGFDMAIATYPVYRMLCGMSLELLYKAIAVSQKHDVKKTHDLVKLAKIAGVKVDDTSKGILEILTECIYWNGRYPVPDKDEQAMQKLNTLSREHLLTNVQNGTTKFYKPNDALNWEHFNEIWLQASRVFWGNHS
jgi:hypothetical protein